MRSGRAGVVGGGERSRGKTVRRRNSGAQGVGHLRGSGECGPRGQNEAGGRKEERVFELVVPVTYH